MTDDDVFNGLVALFKDHYLKRQWDISAHDTAEDIQRRHGDAPLKTLRSLLLLTANHHLAGDNRVVGDPLWDPQRPKVGEKLMAAALALPLK